MKSFFVLLVVIGKIYLGARIMWWVFLKFSAPELHNFSEIDAYVVLLIFDIWVGGQSVEIEKIKEPYGLSTVNTSGYSALTISSFLPS